jgi:hypothetical protein
MRMFNLPIYNYKRPLPSKRLENRDFMSSLTYGIVYLVESWDFLWYYPFKTLFKNLLVNRPNTHFWAQYLYQEPYCPSDLFKVLITMQTHVNCEVDISRMTVTWRLYPHLDAASSWSFNCGVSKFDYGRSPSWKVHMSFVVVYSTFNRWLCRMGDSAEWVALPNDKSTRPVASTIDPNAQIRSTGHLALTIIGPNSNFTRFFFDQ